MRFLALLALVAIFLATPAEARHRHHHQHHAHHHRQHVRVAAPALHKDCHILFPCEADRTPTHAIASGLYRVAAGPATVVAHPAGCPSRAFCGCGAAVRVFGSPVRNLWLAASWYRFPRAAPAPGMVAVRKHHVFVLEASLGSGLWQVYDANSGRHMTRIHARSIAGYTIVNPRSG
jgi:hypothetical protein